MTRLWGMILVLIVPMLVFTGCGPTSSTDPGGAGQSSATAAPTSQGGPAQNPTDDAPIDQSCPTSNTTSFAKTKFVAHAGLAFGAFHHYLWKPLQAGTFRAGARGRLTAFVKGGLAALFVKREIRLASQDAEANPTLCRAIAAPLASIGNTVQSAFDKARNGDPTGLAGANSAIGTVENAAGRAGDPISENDNPDLTSTPR